jgi:hypothetical protein
MNDHEKLSAPLRGAEHYNQIEPSANVRKSLDTTIRVVVGSSSPNCAGIIGKLASELIRWHRLRQSSCLPGPQLHVVYRALLRKGKPAPRRTRPRFLKVAVQNASCKAAQHSGIRTRRRDISGSLSNFNILLDAVR